jgi:hypothetical protein
MHKIDTKNCAKCVHRFNGVNMTCRVTALTMTNKNGECIWFEEGDMSDKSLDIELAKKRMNNKPIYLSMTRVAV